MCNSYLNEKCSTPLFDDSFVRMKFTVSQVRINDATVSRQRQGCDEGGLGQETGRLRTRDVEERFAHSSVALNTNTSAGQPRPTRQLVQVLVRWSFSLRRYVVLAAD